jgi:hypothetical protein
VRILLLFLCAMVVISSGLRASAQDKPRIWVAPNGAWRTHGGSPGQVEGEVENRTIEVSSDFAQYCKDVLVNADFDKANYVVEINRRLKTLPIRIERTDIAVYRWNADLVGGASKSSVGAAVKAGCEIIKKDWPDAPHDARPKKKEDRATKSSTKAVVFRP